MTKCNMTWKNNPLSRCNIIVSIWVWPMWGEKKSNSYHVKSITINQDPSWICWGSSWHQESPLTKKSSFILYLATIKTRFLISAFYHNFNYVTKKTINKAHSWILGGGPWPQKSSLRNKYLELFFKVCLFTFLNSR